MSPPGLWFKFSDGSILGHYGLSRRQVTRVRSFRDMTPDSFPVSRAHCEVSDHLSCVTFSHCHMRHGKSHGRDVNVTTWILWNREPRGVFLPLNCLCRLFLSQPNERYLRAHWLYTEYLSKIWDEEKVIICLSVLGKCIYWRENCFKKSRECFDGVCNVLIYFISWFLFVSVCCRFGLVFCFCEMGVSPCKLCSPGWLQTQSNPPAPVS